MSRRQFSTEFKVESASLVLDKGYTIPEACRAIGVGATAMRRWVEQLVAERDGVTPTNSKALTPEHQKIKELEARILRIEREKEILKKATVDSTGQCNILQLNQNRSFQDAAYCKNQGTYHSAEA